VNGLRLSQVPVALFIWLGAYLGLVSALLITAWRQLDHSPQSQGSVSLAPSKMSPSSIALVAGPKLLCGFFIITFVVAVHPEHRGSSNGFGTQACCLCGGRAFSPGTSRCFWSFSIRRSVTPLSAQTRLSVFRSCDDRSRVSRNFRIFCCADILFARRDS
jgi:hypothetical protein